jgi:hypothetical protein
MEEIPGGSQPVNLHNQQHVLPSSPFSAEVSLQLPAEHSVPLTTCSPPPASLSWASTKASLLTEVLSVLKYLMGTTAPPIVDRTSE